jgi:hypothetical protein
MSKLSVFIFDFQISHFTTIPFHEDRKVYTIMYRAGCDNGFKLARGEARGLIREVEAA